MKQVIGEQNSDDRIYVLLTAVHAAHRERQPMQTKTSCKPGLKLLEIMNSYLANLVTIDGSQLQWAVEAQGAATAVPEGGSLGVLKLPTDCPKHIWTARSNSGEMHAI